MKTKRSADCFSLSVCLSVSRSFFTLFTQVISNVNPDTGAVTAWNKWEIAEEDEKIYLLEDEFPRGVVLDLTNTHQVRTAKRLKEAEPLPPSPRVWVYSHKGIISIYNFVNLSHETAAAPTAQGRAELPFFLIYIWHYIYSFREP